MKSWLTFLPCFLLGILSACNSTKELAMTPEFSANNRSSEINKRLLHDCLIRLFEYRAFEYKLVSSKYADNNITYGIVLPRSWITKQQLEEQTVFGNDSVKCVIQYASEVHTSSRKKHSLVGDIITKNSTYSSNDETETVRHFLHVSGVILYPLLTDSISFWYEDPGDPEMTRGNLLIGKDSLIIKPIFKKARYAPAKLMGLELLKGTTVYAMVQCFPDNISKRNKIFLYTRATDTEQYLIAACFAIVGWYL